MLFSEVIKMAWSSLGANKLRSALTMLGITIGVFSVISVMTAIGALQYSIENGISFLGSNIFQFAKYPANVSASGDVQEKFRNRHNITYKQALHYYRLMEGEAREICLKSFGYEVKGQAVYNGIKTTPSLLIVGTNKSFLTANAHTLGYGRNLNDEDVESFATRNCRRKDGRETIVPARNADRQSHSRERTHLHDRRRARRKRDGIWPKPG